MGYRCRELTIDVEVDVDILAVQRGFKVSSGIV